MAGLVAAVRMLLLLLVLILVGFSFYNTLSSSDRSVVVPADAVVQPDNEPPRPHVRRGKTRAANRVQQAQRQVRQELEQEVQRATEAPPKRKKVPRAPTTTPRRAAPTAAKVSSDRRKQLELQKQQQIELQRRRANYTSIDQLYNEFDAQGVVSDILHLGPRPTVNFFAGQPLNATERVWIFSTDSNYLRCLTRNDHDHVILDLCHPNHFHRQQLLFKDQFMGNFDPTLGEYCVGLDKSNMVVTVPCRASDPTQHWEFVDGKGLVNQHRGLCMVDNEGFSQCSVAPCNASASQWFMRVTNDIMPHADNWARWTATFKERRQAAIDQTRPVVQRALERVAVSRAEPVPETRVNRRVVVFFQPPKYLAVYTQIRWWLLAWRELRLNQPDQKFDVLIYGDIKMLANITRDFKECEQKPLDPTLAPPSESSAGVCWVIPFVGASQRHPEEYDGWFNSIEVLVNENTRPFLRQWTLLLRADADTFPTPRMRDFWVDATHMGRNAGYNNRYSQAKLAEAAADAGLKYINEMHFASSFYGPVDTVLRISDLTMAAGLYLRKHLFSPGLGCRLPSFLRPRGTNCEWGSGLWEGVMLLYSQEVAVNHLLGTNDNIVSFKGPEMDVPTGGKDNICRARMFHVYHMDDRFSKHHFIVGNYAKLDMIDYDLRTTADYCTWLALTANDQGLNGPEVYAKFNNDLSKLCD
ncbi:uncharacterized protein MONBRDRAFT_31271 [Monosiga brevicollis MX1]|uniref:Ricin B lectin domain-containing protein n=1 Tax=Monosiga brevicollis TaxID=81824 RepID=A9USS8_MONBE|nr:uncharacterized protein MONBRDRAFT_31271 [Monosiga brevicollis MX1]EDQ92155.1 predicted protein [Monosiga brevicollis MX1]|eukprot:XP_001743441.1 hypothetical protein [Monosiga brevicollis MX1]